MLEGLRVAVDVQHLYREGEHARDRGSVYTLKDGLVVVESDAVMIYAQSLAAALRELGATVWSNDPAQRLLIGPYTRRHRDAANLGANLYLACHLNAGRGSYALAEYAALGPWVRQSNRLATEVVQALDREFTQVTRGIVRGLGNGERGAVCIRSFDRGPAVLLEPLFGDHPMHQQLLDHASLKSIGLSIARSVTTWWAATRTRVPT